MEIQNLKLAVERNSVAAPLSFFVTCDVIFENSEKGTYRGFDVRIRAVYAPPGHIPATRRVSIGGKVITVNPAAEASSIRDIEDICDFYWYVSSGGYSEHVFTMGICDSASLVREPIDWDYPPHPPYINALTPPESIWWNGDAFAWPETASISMADLLKLSPGRLPKCFFATVSVGDPGGVVALSNVVGFSAQLMMPGRPWHTRR